ILKTHKILLDKKFVLNSAIIAHPMFFNVLYLFGMACSSLLWF
ncbi:hypothetical protein HMPREF1396_00914, partial [Helicobacter pylori GAM114Ai]